MQLQCCLTSANRNKLITFTDDISYFFQNCMKFSLCFSLLQERLLLKYHPHPNCLCPGCCLTSSLLSLIPGQDADTQLVCFLWKRKNSIKRMALRCAKKEKGFRDTRKPQSSSQAFNSPWEPYKQDASKSGIRQYLANGAFVGARSGWGNVFVLLQVKPPKLKFNGLCSPHASGEYVLKWHF